MIVHDPMFAVVRCTRWILSISALVTRHDYMSTSMKHTSQLLDLIYRLASRPSQDLIASEALRDVILYIAKIGCPLLSILKHLHFWYKRDQKQTAYSPELVSDSLL